MLISKPKTLFAGVLAAAMAIVVGCGDGKNRPTPVRRSAMPNGSGQQFKSGNNGDVTTGGSQQQGGGSQTGGNTRGQTPGTQGQQGTAAGNGKQPAGGGKQPSKADPNEAEIQKQEEGFKTGVPITKEELRGSFRLEGIATSVFIGSTTTNGWARAMQVNSVGSNYEISPDSSLSSGFLPSHSENGRLFDIPGQFEAGIQDNKWTTANVFALSLKSFTTTETGKLTITDRLDRAAGGVGLLSLLVNGKLVDRTYTLEDENRKKIEATLYKVNEQTLRVFVSIQEQKPARVDNNGEQSTTFWRNFFLTYKITPSTAK